MSCNAQKNSKTYTENKNITKKFYKMRNFKNVVVEKRHEKLKYKINREAELTKEKCLEEKCQEVEHLLRNNKIDQAFDTIKTFFVGKSKNLTTK